jgi:glycosyltransferase involved in cell wall biosynthesis
MALLPYPIDAAGMRRSPAAADAARAAWRARLTVPPSAPVVLAVAKLHPRETPWDLLRAWVGAAGTDRWLWIAGDGPQRAAVERLVRESALPRVRLLGYVPYPELPDLYAAADLFVHAPREERWGVSVGEALACGLPVVASSRVGAAHDLVVTGVNGFTYPAADSAALAATIGSALALDRGQAMRASEPLIAAWGLEATWSGMVASARRLSGSAA